MSSRSRLVAGIILIIVPTVEIGGASILSLLIADPTYTQNDLRQDLWRAGHAHAGVWLVLSLVALRYVDEAALSEGMRWVVRDRKSTRLNSSHANISYAVFCLKKKKQPI